MVAASWKSQPSVKKKEIAGKGVGRDYEPCEIFMTQYFCYDLYDG